MDVPKVDYLDAKDLTVGLVSLTHDEATILRRGSPKGEVFLPSGEVVRNWEDLTVWFSAERFPATIIGRSLELRSVPILAEGSSPEDLQERLGRPDGGLVSSDSLVYLYKDFTLRVDFSRVGQAGFWLHSKLVSREELISVARVYESPLPGDRMRLRASAALLLKESQVNLEIALDRNVIGKTERAQYELLAHRLNQALRISNGFEISRLVHDLGKLNTELVASIENNTLLEPTAESLRESKMIACRSLPVLAHQESEVEERGLKLRELDDDIVANPMDWRPYFRRAMFYSHEGQHERARVDFLKAEELKTGGSRKPVLRLLETDVEHNEPSSSQPKSPSDVRKDDPEYREPNSGG